MTEGNPMICGICGFGHDRGCDGQSNGRIVTMYTWVHCRSCGTDATTDDWDENDGECPACGGDEADGSEDGPMVEPGDDYEVSRDEE